MKSTKNQHLQSFGTHTAMIFVCKFTPHASYQTKISGVDTSYAPFQIKILIMCSSATCSLDVL